MSDADTRLVTDHEIVTPPCHASRASTDPVMQAERNGTHRIQKITGRSLSHKLLGYI
jgi:hypothetical protein